MRELVIVLIYSASVLIPAGSNAEDGYRLWLGYDRISDPQKLTAYRQSIKGWIVDGESPTLNIVKNELALALGGLLGQPVPGLHEFKTSGLLVCGTSGSRLLSNWKLKDKLKSISSEGFIIANASINNKDVIVIAANEDVGVLYGVFHFLRLLQTRAFVYDDKVQDDRAKQAFNEFKPLDGSFNANVLVQVKNGPIDFQPREPFHPLFGAMPQTPLMIEFQITQEYLGFSTHLVYLAMMFKETLESDTYNQGKGSTVAKVIDGTVDRHAISGIAGVANIGTDRNWCGHPFAQANWYSFGRLAWDHQLSADQIADEWIRMTFTNAKDFISPVKSMMLSSREVTVDYMTPLGLHHIMGWGHHYGPGPWIKDKPRADWTSVYFHRADSLGIGFDRNEAGSNAINQYHPEVQKIYSSPTTCPEKFLLWFHHLPWNHKLRSGETLWNSLCIQYQRGVDSVRWMQEKWDSLKGKVDEERFVQVKALLAIQEKEAVWWRDACLLYFQTFSRLPLPEGVDKPRESLNFYQKLEFPNAPGIRPRW